MPLPLPSSPALALAVARSRPCPCPRRPLSSPVFVSEAYLVLSTGVNLTGMRSLIRRRLPLVGQYRFGSGFSALSALASGVISGIQKLRVNLVSLASHLTRTGGREDSDERDKRTRVSVTVNAARRRALEACDMYHLRRSRAGRPFSGPRTRPVRQRSSPASQTLAQRAAPPVRDRPPSCSGAGPCTSRHAQTHMSSGARGSDTRALQRG